STAPPRAWPTRASSWFAEPAPYRGNIKDLAPHTVLTTHRQPGDQGDRDDRRLRRSRGGLARRVLRKSWYSGPPRTREKSSESARWTTLSNGAGRTKRPPASPVQGNQQVRAGGRNGRLRGPYRSTA